MRKNDAWEEICIASKGDDFNEASEEMKIKFVSSIFPANLIAVLGKIIPKR